MGCRYEWADENHIIMNAYIEFPWSWQEYDGIADQMFTLITQENHPCATVVEVTRMGNMPRGNIMGSLTRMEKLIPTNVFASAIVGAPYAAMVFLDILFRIRPRAKRIAIFTKTMPEAHQKINDIYKSQFAASNRTKE